MALRSYITTASAVGVLSLVLMSAPAHAVVFSFDNIAGGDTTGDSFNQYLSVDVTQSGNEALFTFSNSSSNTATDSFISDIFFDVRAPEAIGTASGDVDILAGTGVSFTYDAGGNLPQGNNAVPAFDPDFSIINEPGSANGIQPGEILAVAISLTGSFQDVLNALASGTLRIGLHVQGLPNGGSDAYINNPTAVPLPMAFLLGAPVLGGLLLAGRRNRKAVA
jgi:hypothetical protein